VHQFSNVKRADDVRELSADSPRTWKEYSTGVLPNGVATGLDIGFSNASLSIITLSFYTMCKSSAPLFLLLFAFLWRIETPTWGLAGIVAVISTGLVMLVDGEVEFNLLGFFLVMSAAAMSGIRWTIAQILLQVRHAAFLSLRYRGWAIQSRAFICSCAYAVLLMILLHASSNHVA
jgi:hypothetical protein